MDTLQASHRDAFQALILNLGKVPVIDATGFAALENTVDTLVRRGKVVILAGPLPRPQSVFDKAKLDTKHAGMIRISPDLAAAVGMARELDLRPPSRRPSRFPTTTAAE
jgi:sulfate permease, SulP family